MTTIVVPSGPDAKSEAPDVQEQKSNTSGAYRLHRTKLWTLVEALPSVVVMASLVGLAVLGHRYHWKIPKFSHIAGSPPPVESDWCTEHSVPESQCVTCHPEKGPPSSDFGWCDEHGVHNCVVDHPELAQLRTTPVVAAEERERVANALALRERTANNSACTLYQRYIQFASDEAFRKAGVRVAYATRQPISEWITAQGEASYDATQTACLSCPVAGVVWRILKNLGDPVRKGDVLALVDAQEVGRAKSDLVKALVAEDLARKNVTRLAELSGGAVAGRHLIEAEAELAQAQAQVLSGEQMLANLGLRVDVNSLRGKDARTIIEALRFLGVPHELVDQLDADTATANLIPIRSPLDGIIVERNVVAGEVVDPARTLFRVVNPRQMWLTLNVPLEHLPLLGVGQEVRFLPSGGRREVAGVLSWISTSADRQTRMVQARAVVDNSDGYLRDGTFGTGRLIVRRDTQAIVVPKNAVHWEGCCHVVFVRDRNFGASADGSVLFHVRSVRVGGQTEDYTEILAGVLPGEVVAAEGSDVLRAQLLKHKIGQGCCPE